MKLGNPAAREGRIREENERQILDGAEIIFSEFGYGGATISKIAEYVELPAANIHYYFHTKQALYERVVERIFYVWLDAAKALDEVDDPIVAITLYIHRKMDLSRQRPSGSKVWANEIIQGAPVMQGFLETKLREWTASRTRLIQKWIEDGKMNPVDPNHLLFLIWSATQHYADFGHQILILNNGEPLTDEYWKNAKETVSEIVLRGIGAIR